MHKWRDAFVSKELFVNDLFCLMTIFPFLARSFCRIQGLGRIQNGAVLLYREYLNLVRKRSSREKKPLKNGVVLLYIEDVRTGKNNTVIAKKGIDIFIKKPCARKKLCAKRGNG